MNYILNGQAHGDVASVLMANKFNPQSLRPYIGKDDRSYITVNDENNEPKAVPIQNAATLRKDDWIRLDEAIVAAAKPRLRAVQDLRDRGLEYNIPNGMGTTVLQTETQSDITPADISMDGLRESEADRPVFDITNLPLPIIHKDFHFSARQVEASRQGGSPLDTTTAELASRRVSEEAEKLLIGVRDSYEYGGGTIYGYTNIPQRLLKTITDPNDSGWTPADTVQEVLEMRKLSQQAYHYGPWVLYNSPDWDVFMDDDYSSQKGDNTLRERIQNIQGIEEVRTLDYMNGYDLLLVQMTSDVARQVVGMDITTVQWETKGGMQLNFKVMAILVPQLRADHNDNTGIVHGSIDES